MQASAKDLRFHLKELLDSVLKGEEIVITFRGKPIAKLIPFKNMNDNSNNNEKNELFGMWKDKEDIKNVDKYIRNVRKGRFS